MSKYKELDDAIIENNIIKVRELLNIGIDINIGDINGNTPILLAINRKRINICKLFLKYPNINVNIQNYYGLSPVIQILKINNIELQKLFFTKDIDYNMITGSGKTILEYILFSKNNVIIKYIFDNIKPNDLTIYTKRRVLTILIENNNLHLFFLFFNKFINIKDFSCSDFIEICFITSQVNYNKIEKSQSEKFLEVLINLLEKMRNNLQNLNEFINDNLGENIVDRNNSTPLYYAIKNNNTILINWFLKNKIYNLHQTGVYGKEFIKVLHEDNVNIMKLFVNYIPSLTTYQNICSILSYCVNNSSINIMRYFLKLDKDLVNAELDTEIIGNKTNILFLAIKYKKIDILEEIIKYNHLNINDYDEFGHTPIHCAIINEDVKQISLLLSHPNIDVNLKTKTTGFTVYDFICSIKNIHIRQFILDCFKDEILVSPIMLYG